MWRTYFFLSILLPVVSITGLILAALPLGEVSSRAIDYADAFVWILTLANLLAINYLYRFGTLSRSPWRRGVFLLIALFFIVALSRIQHWGVTNYLAPVFFLGVPLFYAAWFFRKPAKRLNDYLKLLWVVVHFPLSLAHFQHLPIDLGPWGTIASSGLLLVVYVHFYVMQKREPPAMDVEWDIPGVGRPE